MPDSPADPRLRSSNKQAAAPLPPPTPVPALPHAAPATAAALETGDAATGGPEVGAVAAQSNDAATAPPTQPRRRTCSLCHVRSAYESNFCRSYLYCSGCDRTAKLLRQETNGRCRVQHLRGAFEALGGHAAEAAVRKRALELAEMCAAQNEDCHASAANAKGTAGGKAGLSRKRAGVHAEAGAGGGLKRRRVAGGFAVDGAKTVTPSRGVPDKVLPALDKRDATLARRVSPRTPAACDRVDAVVLSREAAAAAGPATTDRRGRSRSAAPGAGAGMLVGEEASAAARESRAAARGKAGGDATGMLGHPKRGAETRGRLRESGRDSGGAAVAAATPAAGKLRVTGAAAGGKACGDAAEKPGARKRRRSRYSDGEEEGVEAAAAAAAAEEVAAAALETVGTPARGMVAAAMLGIPGTSKRGGLGGAERETAVVPPCGAATPPPPQQQRQRHHRQEKTVAGTRANSSPGAWEGAPAAPPQRLPPVSQPAVPRMPRRCAATSPLIRRPAADEARAEASPPAAEAPSEGEGRRRARSVGARRTKDAAFPLTDVPFAADTSFWRWTLQRVQGDRRFEGPGRAAPQGALQQVESTCTVCTRQHLHAPNLTRGMAIYCKRCQRVKRLVSETGATVTMALLRSTFARHGPDVSDDECFSLALAEGKRDPSLHAARKGRRSVGRDSEHAAGGVPLGSSLGMRANSTPGSRRRWTDPVAPPAGPSTVRAATSSGAIAGSQGKSGATSGDAGAADQGDAPEEVNEAKEDNRAGAVGCTTEAAKGSVGSGPVCSMCMWRMRAVRCGYCAECRRLRKRLKGPGSSRGLRTAMEQLGRHAPDDELLTRAREVMRQDGLGEGGDGSGAADAVGGCGDTCVAEEGHGAGARGGPEAAPSGAPCAAQATAPPAEAVGRVDGTEATVAAVLPKAAAEAVAVAGGGALVADAAAGGPAAAAADRAAASEAAAGAGWSGGAAAGDAEDGGRASIAAVSPAIRAAATAVPEAGPAVARDGLLKLTRDLADQCAWRATRKRTALAQLHSQVMEAVVVRLLVSVPAFPAVFVTMAARRRDVCHGTNQLMGTKR